MQKSKTSLLEIGVKKYAYWVLKVDTLLLVYSVSWCAPYYSTMEMPVCGGGQLVTYP